MRDGKKLRLGYTTGSCAAAAAKAAAWMLLRGGKKETIRLLTPKGIELTLAVEDIHSSPDCVRCAIRKDSGDDPDITRDTLIYAEVRKTEDAGIVIDGGQGVGRVIKPGLDQPVGAAAINSVPRRMIRENVEEVCGLLGYTGGLRVVISVPEGEALAKKTFNPRLGIEGGISILGTTGIVEPMSEQALVDTIHVELRQRRESGADYVLLARSEGMGRAHIVLRQCLRNVLPSYLSLMAISVPHVMGGTYIVEAVFSYPGLGTLSYESARYKDYNLLMVLCLLSGAVVIACSLLAQAMNARLDPRLRPTEREVTSK